MRRTRHLMTFSHRLALVAMLGSPLSACGKKEEPPPAPVADTTPAAKEEVKTPPPETKPAEKPVEQPAANTPPERGGMKLGSVATFPEDMVAVAGVKSLSQLIAAFSSQAQAIGGLEVPPDALKSALEGLKAQTGVDFAWLDAEKPMQIAVPNPKKYPEGFVAIFPVKEGTKLDVAALPNPAKDAEGHTAKLDLGGKTLFVDDLGTHVLVTSHGTFKTEFESFFKEVAAWNPSEPIIIDSSVENLTKIFGDELGEAKKSLTELTGMLTQGADSSQAATLMQAADFGFAFIEGTTRMAIALDPTGDFPRLGLAFAGKPESAVGKLVANANGRKVALATTIPAEAWLAIGYNIEGFGYMSNAKDSLDQLLAMPNPVFASFTEADKTELGEKLNKLQELQGTESVTWIRQDGPKPFVLQGIADAKDGPALMQAFFDFGDFFFKKIWTMARPQMLKSGQVQEADAPENLDFRGFAALVSKVASAMGMSLEVKEAATKNGGTARAVEFGIDWAKIPPAPETKLVSNWLGDKLGFGFAAEGKYLATSLSADAAASAAALLDRGVPSDAADTWIGKAKDNAFFFLVRPARLLKVLAEALPQMSEKKGVIDTLADEPIALTGMSDGSMLNFEITLPMSMLKGFAQLQ